MGSTRLTGVRRLKRNDPSRALKHTGFSKMLRESFFKEFCFAVDHFLNLWDLLQYCFVFWLLGLEAFETLGP